jgi:antitoxin MazE
MKTPVRAIIRKWGNSPALRLNASVMEKAEFSLEQPVQLKVTRGRIVIEPAEPFDYRLDDLVAKITPDNLHGEVATGRAVGKEVL